MSGLSLLEILLVLGISAGVLVWQTQVWRVPEPIELRESSAQDACSIAPETTHRRQEEAYWFSEQGELICG